SRPRRRTSVIAASSLEKGVGLGVELGRRAVIGCLLNWNARPTEQAAQRLPAIPWLRLAEGFASTFSRLLEILRGRSLRRAGYEDNSAARKAFKFSMAESRRNPSGCSLAKAPGTSRGHSTPESGTSILSLQRENLALT